MTAMEIGTVIRDRRWGGHCTGTVTGNRDGSIFVAWHGSFVEDELDPNDVAVVGEAPDELRAWRGGIRVFARDGSYGVLPVIEAGG